MDSNLLKDIEVAAIWSAVTFSSLGFITFLAAAIYKKTALTQWGWRAALMVTALSTLSLGTRWAATGHPPVQGAYEHIMAAGWFFILLYLLIVRWYPGSKGLGIALLPLWTLIMGQVLLLPDTFPSGHAPLGDPYKSPWLWIHVIFGWFAFGSYTIGMVMSVIYLKKERRHLAEDAEMEITPRLQMLDDLTLKTILFGFVSQALLIVAGSIWANALWGSYWTWDPVETWALVSWLTYAVYLHLRITLGWEGKKAAWLSIAAFLSLFISFGGIAWMGGPHTPLITPPQGE